jgi:ATP-binding cassette subfamily B protein
MSLGNGVIMLTDSIVLTVLTLSIMLSINVRLTLLSLIPLPFVALVATKFGKTIHNKFMKVQEAFSKLTDVVQENFSGIRIIKSFVQEQREYEKFTKENTYNFDANMSLIKVWGMFFPLVEFLSSLSFVVLIGVGGIYAVYGYISLGDFISFNMYLGMLVWPMMAVGWVINIIQRGFASLERIENILNQKPDILDNKVDNISSIDGDIDLKDLTFTYPGSTKPSLKNIDLSVKKGQTLGIIGRTGSGKSTFVNLLVRLYNVEDNKIFINGTDINRIPLKVLRENIGFVPQDSFLFSTTLSENVNLAHDNFEMDKVIKSAESAHIHDDIMDFSEKYDTIIGERGVTLSGGQKQRISIARALIKDPEILVFDDCLSAVDAKTEVKILESLKKIMQNKTSIIISHRISAVKDSDMIAVFDDGNITEIGTHKDLVDLKGLYYGIYEKQLIEEKIQEEEA